jgi:hypothetical protein
MGMIRNSLSFGDHTHECGIEIASQGARLGNQIFGNAARAWVANLICYWPVVLHEPFVVNRVWWVNGSTVTTTNVDFGIYDTSGTRLYNTGATAMSGASSRQYVTVGAPFTLQPGTYYFAWTCNNTTNRGNAFAGGVIVSRALGLLEETTAGFGLPATWTPVAWARAWGPSFAGITNTTSGY